MTIDQLARRLEALGFLCGVDHFEDDHSTRLIVRKLRSTPGNHVANYVVGYHPNGYDRSGRGKEPLVELDGAAPIIWFRKDVIEYSAGVVILGGRAPGAYEKTFHTADEVYEELLHYFFDADSPMRLENDFVPGPGRPPGA
jgi:hypothetical protein